ncbi:MAG: NAD(P)/FAD-dependent oxidoreductase [Nocardioides sp.]
MSHYDVVVVGGRVAGASTALLLARRGARVAVVERGTLDQDPVSTHALMRAGVLQLARWGVLDAIVARGTPPSRQTTFRYPDGERVRVSIRAADGVDALYAPRRTLLDRLLIDVAEEAGAEVYRCTAVSGVTRTREGRVNGVAIRRGSTDTALRADLVIGADGFRSTVARDVDAATLLRGSAASSVLYRYVRGLDVRGYEWLYGDRAAAGLIPTNDEATCVFVSATPARMRQLRRGGRRHAFLSLLQACGPEVHDLVRDAPERSAVRGWRGAAGRVRQSWGPGWALVGDAGYYKDPVTAHGITDALRDAELLADAVLATSASRDRALAMAAYQDKRDQLSRAFWDATEEVAGFAWDAARVRALLRAASAAMSDEVDHLSRVPGRASGVRSAVEPLSGSSPRR